MISLKTSDEPQPITPKTQNLCSACHCGRLGDTKVSPLVPVCAQSAAEHQQGSEPSNAEGQLHVSV